MSNWIQIVNFPPVDYEIWWMTSKNNRAILLHYVKLCASFQIHWWIQTGFTIQKRSIRVEIGDILYRVTLKFDGWPWKTIGHLFYTTPRFVHHFKAIREAKPELQSGNAQVGSKLANLCPAWPWNVMDDLEKKEGTSSMLLQPLCIISYPLVNSNWNYSPETPNLGPSRRILEPCDLEIWRMTLKNNRAPLPCYFNLCASFRTHWWIQTGVTVPVRPICVKFNDLFSRVT